MIYSYASYDPETYERTVRHFRTLKGSLCAAYLAIELETQEIPCCVYDEDGFYLGLDELYTSWVYRGERDAVTLGELSRTLGDLYDY